MTEQLYYFIILGLFYPYFLCT